MSAIDLTPFGFTPTETLVYDALLNLGPASGYAVAKDIGMARANAYQALNSLVTKGAATLIDDNPQRFRAVKPEALLARIASGAADRLARLEREILGRGATGDDAIVAVSGERGLMEVITRWAGRAAGDVLCVAPQALLDALQPVWRKREVDGADTRLQATEAASDHVPAQAVLFWCETAGLIGLAGDGAHGHWFSDPTLLVTTRLAINQLVG
ncbi:MAG: helix-turn-helix domain-containing protein [Gemmatimonadales bacterium]